jgi:hypothetical protein
MAIDAEKQVSASVILTKELYERIKKIAKDNKRSASAQMALIIEDNLDKYEKKNT